MDPQGFAKLKTFVLEELVTDAAGVDEGTRLFSTRLVHSRNLMHLVRFLEDTFKIRFSPMDMTTANLDTIHAMKAFIERKKGGAAPRAAA